MHRQGWKLAPRFGVMPELVPGIHASVQPMLMKREFDCACKTLSRASLDGVDGRDKTRP
jgi:hypothetical protein